MKEKLAESTTPPKRDGTTRSGATRPEGSRPAGREPEGRRPGDRFDQRKVARTVAVSYVEGSLAVQQITLPPIESSVVSRDVQTKKTDEKPHIDSAQTVAVSFVDGGIVITPAILSSADTSVVNNYPQADKQEAKPKVSSAQPVAVSFEKGGIVIEHTNLSKEEKPETGVNPLSLQAVTTLMTDAPLPSTAELRFISLVEAALPAEHTDELTSDIRRDQVANTHRDLADIIVQTAVAAVGQPLNVIEKAAGEFDEAGGTDLIDRQKITKNLGELQPDDYQPKIEYSINIPYTNSNLSEGPKSADEILRVNVAQEAVATRITALMSELNGTGPAHEIRADIVKSARQVTAVIVGEMSEVERVEEIAENNAAAKDITVFEDSKRRKPNYRDNTKKPTEHPLEINYLTRLARVARNQHPPVMEKLDN
jgi:hypothetical protein